VGILRGGIVHTDIEIDNLQASNNTWTGKGFDPAGSVGVGYVYNQRATVSLSYRVQGSPTVRSSSGSSKPGNFSDIQLGVWLKF
jgi:hypothetical protein